VADEKETQTATATIVKAYIKQFGDDFHAVNQAARIARAEAQARADVEAQPRKDSTAAKIRWHGSAVDFADWVARAYDEGRGPLKAKSLSAAFELASQHFCQKNGESFKKRSLLQSRRYRIDLKG
jgi:hypothetical protein